RSSKRSTANASSDPCAEDGKAGCPANANDRAVSLALNGVTRRTKNKKGLERVAAELDRRRARPGVKDGWVTFDSRGAAEDLGMQPRTVERDLDLMVGKYNILEERQLPAPDEEVTDKAG